jgi:uncharacterized membrane protein YfcA
VRYERSDSPRWGLVVGLLLFGLVVGGVVGGWIGSIVGVHHSDAAEAAGECYLEGCGFMVVGYAFYGVLLGLTFGAILGGLMGVKLGRKPKSPSASDRTRESLH